MKRKSTIRKVICGIALFSMTAMSMLSLTACRGTLATAMEEKEKNKVVVKEDVGDLDLTTLYDDTNGYQYRNTQWLIPENELEKAWSADIGDGQPYTMQGDMIYTETTGVAASINGVDPSGASLIMDSSGRYSQIMLQFEINENLNSEDLSSLFETTKETLIENYGEPTEVIDDQDVSYNDKNNVRTGKGQTLKWDCTLDNGYVTSMQLVTITMNGAQNISTMLFGFNCYDPVAVSSMAAEQESLLNE